MKLVFAPLAGVAESDKSSIASDFSLNLLETTGSALSKETSGSCSAGEARLLTLEGAISEHESSSMINSARAENTPSKNINNAIVLALCASACEGSRACGWACGLMKVDLVLRGCGWVPVCAADVQNKLFCISLVWNFAISG